MLSPDPAICLIHPTKHPVGVCHLCLRDRLVRLSISGDSSSSHTVAPTSSSRSSSSSCSKPEDSFNCGGVVPVNEVGKLGTIFSLIESENEGQAMDSGSSDAPAAPAFSRSQSLSNSSLFQHQQPRRSTSIKDSVFSRFPPDAKEGQIESLPLPLPPPLPRPPPQQPQQQFQAMEALRKSKSVRRNGFFFHSPLPKPLASSTPLVNPVPGFVDTEKQQQNHKHFSWISSLFRLRKRKKKASSSNGELQATETNFFPPEGWGDSVPGDDKLWRSRSVSSGRVLKRSSVGDSSLVRTPQAQPISSLIAVDMKKVDNVLYDPEDDDGPSTDTVAPPRTVASLMDLDHQQQNQMVRFGRSSSTGKWRKRTRGESPSSVLTHQPSSEWSFYLTPLRTFRRNTSSRQP